MTQPTNPLALSLKGAAGKGRVTAEMLHDLAERSNRYPWVAQSGHPYFVNRRWDEKESRYVHFLDRS